jgi:hypothetical protein
LKGIRKVLAYRIFWRMEGLLITSELGQEENNFNMEWQNVEVKMRGTQRVTTN